jgi:hypothetical protein
MVLYRVTMAPSTGNLSIPCTVDGTARMADIPGLPMMPLYGKGDLITIKFIQAAMECSLLPTTTSNRICPMGHIFSLVNPVNDVVAGLN